MIEKVTMKTPLVEMNGDEMTRVIWAWVKDILLLPFVDLKTDYFDLGLEERERSRDAVTTAAAEATLSLGVAVKCATITPNEERLHEYGLSELYKSPNASIRAILDGTVFRAPIMVSGIEPYLPNWKHPITIARHAYGDVYKSVEMLLDDEWATSRVELLATRADGEQRRLLVHDFGATAAGIDAPAIAADVHADSPAAAVADTRPEGGIIQGMHNSDASITSFARACFEYALSARQDLWFSTKDTISKIYDRRFRDIFTAIYDAEYRERFEQAGIEYFYTLIDDAVARVVRSEGGFIWACKNYDGDVMSDMVATAFGSLALMSSVLVSPSGCFEYEAAHGTVQRHYYRYLQGETTSTNPVATIFAWTGALAKRGELDDLPELVAFARRLEAATLDTIAAGDMTADLFALSKLPEKRCLDSEAFIRAIASRLV